MRDALGYRAAPDESRTPRRVHARGGRGCDRAVRGRRAGASVRIGGRSRTSSVLRRRRGRADADPDGRRAAGPRWTLGAAPTATTAPTTGSTSPAADHVVAGSTRPDADTDTGPPTAVAVTASTRPAASRTPRRARAARVAAPGLPRPGDPRRRRRHACASCSRTTSTARSASTCTACCYDKGSEGAPYADGTTAAQQGDDAVPPGTTYTYNYTVPDRAGPGPMEGSSVMWMYHSHTDEVGDTYCGLMGPVIVTAAGHGPCRTARPRTSTARSSVFQVSGREPEPRPAGQHGELSSPRPGRRGVRRVQPDAQHQRLRLRQPAARQRPPVRA